MKKEYTPFGKFFSDLRKRRKHTITDAAELLNVSISYISAVEHGDREIPSTWRDRIIKIYQLGDDEINQMNEAYYNTPAKQRISFDDLKSALINMLNNECDDPILREKYIKATLNTLEKLRK